MQNGVIYFPDSTNIGDDIQTYAASLQVDNSWCGDRGRLEERTEDTRLLCNGWFMAEAQHWPPSDKVKPLFMSFHISSKNQELMTSPEAIAYYKKYEPIGCRDYHTLDLLKSHDIEAYFSGCMTLTIPKYEGERGEEILFVDVLRTNYTDHYRKTVVQGLVPAGYEKKVNFVTHFSDKLKSLSVETRMAQATEMLDRYAKAKLVITSLIHCALPCVALGTPVVFVDFGFNNDAAKRDRFNGIIDLFHIESDLKAPFMERNFIGKLGRGLRLYNLMKNQITPLPEEIFQYAEVTTKHLELSEGLKARIANHFKT